MTSKNLQARVVEQLNRKLNCVDPCVQTFDCQYQADSWLQRLPSSWFWFKADQNFLLTACSIYFEKGVKDCGLLKKHETILGWDTRNARSLFPESIKNYIYAVQKVNRSGLPFKWVNRLDIGFVKSPFEAESHNNVESYLISSGEIVLHILYKNPDGTLSCAYR